MQALTFSAPWSVFVVRTPEDHDPRYALKRWETRSWYISPKKLPMRVAVHSAKRLDPLIRERMTMQEPKLRGRMPRRVFSEPYASALTSIGYAPLDPWQRDYLDHLDTPGLRPIPVAAITGFVTIAECVPADAVTRAYWNGQVSELEIQLGDFSPGRFAWLLTDPIPLETPVPCVGKQGLWYVEPPLALKLAQSLANQPHSFALYA